jgi:bacterioferritin-associated ferredoxin
MNLTCNKKSRRLFLTMLVCHCKRVHCRDIRAAAQAGASDADSVGRACGAGTGCGGCKPLVQKLVEKEQRALPVVSASMAPAA